MPESTDAATILIATSWQALGRAETGDRRASICNCTVLIVFAAFFLEANLNHVIRSMGKREEMRNFLKIKKRKAQPGLQDKLAWFYNAYIARSKTTNKKELYRRMRRKWRGFNQLYEFRNKVAHGEVDRSMANLGDAKRLRALAKAIVTELFTIAAREGHDIPRGVTYEAAITASDRSS